MVVTRDVRRTLMEFMNDGDKRPLARAVLMRALSLARAVRLFDGKPMDTSDLLDGGCERVGYYLRASSALEEAAEALLTAIELECGDDGFDVPY